MRNTKSYYSHIESVTQKTFKFRSTLRPDVIESNAHRQYVNRNQCSLEEAFIPPMDISYVDFLVYMKNDSTIVNQWGHDSLFQ